MATPPQLTPEQRARFFRQLPDFERMLVDEGITLVKLWLEVGRAEQLRRFLAPGRGYVPTTAQMFRN